MVETFSCENSPKNSRVPGCSRIFTILLTHNSHMPRDFQTGADFLASSSRREPETCARLSTESSAPSFIKTLFYSQLDARRMLCHVLVRFYFFFFYLPRERFCPFDRDKEAWSRSINMFHGRVAMESFQLSAGQVPNFQQLIFFFTRCTFHSCHFDNDRLLHRRLETLG